MRLCPRNGDGSGRLQASQQLAPFQPVGSGDVLENPAAVVGQHQKHIQNLEPDCRQRNEVIRNNGVDVIFEEAPPRLRWRITMASCVLAGARVSESNAKLEKFAVNPRCAPERAYRGSSHESRIGRTLGLLVAPPFPFESSISVRGRRHFGTNRSTPPDS